MITVTTLEEISVKPKLSRITFEFEEPSDTTIVLRIETFPFDVVGVSNITPTTLVLLVKPAPTLHDCEIYLNVGLAALRGCMFPGNPPSCSFFFKANGDWVYSFQKGKLHKAKR